MWNRLAACWWSDWGAIHPDGGYPPLEEYLNGKGLSMMAVKEIQQAGFRPLGDMPPWNMIFERS